MNILRNPGQVFRICDVIPGLKESLKKMRGLITEGMPEDFFSYEFLIESVDIFLEKLLIKFLVESLAEFLVKSLV